MFCSKCGIELREGDKFCSSCGTGLENRIEREMKIDGDMGLWVRGHGRSINLFFGAVGVFTSPTGWQWYFETGYFFAFISELTALLIGIFLLLLGLFPVAVCKKVGLDTKDKYISTSIILIAIQFIIFGLEPASIYEANSLVNATLP